MAPAEIRLGETALEAEWNRLCAKEISDQRFRVVRWIDSSLQNDQVDRHDFPKPVTITSVGIVVEETEEYITLARDDMGHDGDYRGLVSIPRIAVIEGSA